MKSIHIRNLDEDTLRGLKRRAQRHHRSLQKEVEVLLTDASRMLPEDTSLRSPLEQLHCVNTGQSASEWSRESIYGNDGR